MKIKLTFPINFEEVSEKTGTTMVGGSYPISVDGKNVGEGKVLEVNGFDLIIEVDEEAEKSYRQNFTEEELEKIIVE